MNDKDHEAFEQWLKIEFGETVDLDKAYLYEKSIFRFACEYKDKEILAWKEAARSEAAEVNSLYEEINELKNLTYWKIEKDGEVTRHLSLSKIVELQVKNKKLIDGLFEIKELIEFEYGDCNCDSENNCSYCRIMEKIKEVENESNL